MKYNMKEKVLWGAGSIVGLLLEAICLPIYLVIACIYAAKYRDARNYFVGTFYGIGYGVAARAMYVSAMAVAVFSKEKSDWFCIEGNKYLRKYIGSFDSLYS